MEGEFRGPRAHFPSLLHLPAAPETWPQDQGGPRTEKEARLQSNPLNFIDGKIETQRGEGVAQVAQ